MANKIAQKKAKKKAKRKVINKEKNRIARILKKENDLIFASSLQKQGYLRVSRKHFMLSRLDREDWKEHMAISHSPWSFKEGMEWVEILDTGAEDHYRRCYSKDKITVTKDVSNLIESSDWKTVGYIQ